MTFRKNLFVGLVAATAASTFLPHAARAGNKIDFAEDQISELYQDGVNLAAQGQCEAAGKKIDTIVEIIKKFKISTSLNKPLPPRETEILNMQADLYLKMRNCRLVASFGNYRVPDYSKPQR